MPARTVTGAPRKAAPALPRMRLSRVRVGHEARQEAERPLAAHAAATAQAREEQAGEGWPPPV